MDNKRYLKRLGKNIKEVREKRKMSEDQLAVVASMDRTYLTDIENGKANPTVKILWKIARGLKVRVYKLCEGV